MHHKYLFFVYILKCSDNSFYTGVTNNIERRIHEHQNGLTRNCYTYTRRPLQLVYTTEFNDIRMAIEFEKKIKKWSRDKKIALINHDWNKLHHLAIRRTPNK